MRIDDSGIRGVGNVNGGSYKNFKIAGSATVNEDCKAEKIKIAGNADFKASVTANTFKVAGRCSVGGNVKVDKLSIAGSFTVRGNIDAEGASLAGMVNIDGDVNCEKFVANVSASNFKNLYGESIIFENTDSLSAKTNVDEIAATTIEINNIKANKISGEFITIGNGCVVELVEYNNTLSVSRTAKIERIVKI
jgi:cytoskeletal protein CcmA (bactofilin family)